jgi:Zn-dependent protease with chaperone function
MITSPTQLADSSQKCPQCGAPLTVEPGYVIWCDRCDWNVRPQQRSRSRGRIEALYDSLGERFGRNLFAEIKQERSLKPHWTIARATAWLLALSVHSLTLALFFLGLIFMLNNRGDCLSLFGGITCLGLAWMLRPHPTKLPGNLVIAPREKSPAIYRHVDQIAAALHAPRVDGIVISADFNAAYLTTGWRRKRIIMLGLPLLSILSPQEQVAVIAHELAHSVNGDPARGLIVGTALGTLTHWYVLLLPDPKLGHRYGLPGMFANGVLLMLSLFPWAVAQALIHLLYRDSQRAEYLADRLAVQISGTAAALSALEKMHLSDTFILCVKRSALNSSITNFFTEFRERVAHLPPHELERIRRAERLHGSRLNMTHPPTVYRSNALQAHFVTDPQIACDADSTLAIKQELAAFEVDIDRELKRRYEAILYA